MNITRNNQPLNYKIYDDFMLKMIGFDDQLLKNIKAKFKWVATIGEKLNISSPHQLIDYELPPVERKRKRTNEFIKEVFVFEDVVVDGLVEARFNEQPQIYLSQRHRQGSQRLLEDMLVSWDGYQLVVGIEEFEVLKTLRVRLVRGIFSILMELESDSNSNYDGIDHEDDDGDDDDDGGNGNDNC
ncbi:hypothetical protein Tco_0751397 [Tanacetum coccineum]|uniref:Uncharacterized protein n=1 Tax=Tanacetum coccineum TaxID=301880 RepID=A0ABQ4Z6J6_9ASTR